MRVRRISQKSAIFINKKILLTTLTRLSLSPLRFEIHMSLRLSIQGIVPQLLIRYAHKYCWTRLACFCSRIGAKTMTPPFDSSRKCLNGTYFTPHCRQQKSHHKDGFSVGSAGERNRTPDLCLEGRCFTTKLHPHLVPTRQL